jgi:hypothetical protein
LLAAVAAGHEIKGEDLVALAGTAMAARETELALDVLEGGEHALTHAVELARVMVGDLSRLRRDKAQDG